MADNDKATNDSSGTGEDASTSKQQGTPDYNKLVSQHSSGNPVDGGLASNRDLGTVGGGSIPGTGKSTMGTGNAPGGMSTSNSTVDGGNSVGGSPTGAGSSSDRGTQTATDIAGHRANTQDPHAQGNIGGRNPSQPQTAMGDQDARSNREDRGEPQVTEPMTSRDPDAVNQQSSQGS